MVETCIFEANDWVDMIINFYFTLLTAQYGGDSVFLFDRIRYARWYIRNTGHGH